MLDAVPLRGGYVNDVVRVGDAVRRRLREPHPFVHDLLVFLEDRGWPGAPRFRGSDDQGREVLTFLDGYVPWAGTNEPAGVWSADSVARVAEFTRQLHDLTAGTSLAGEAEVVCHNDLSPRNTVYRPVAAGGTEELRPVAFIDWDIAAPGRRVHDLAHLCWQWACGATTSLDAATSLIRVAVDAYRCADGDRVALIDTILWWQERCWRGIQAKIDAGEPEVQRLKEAGAVRAVQADWRWTQQHRLTLEQAISA